MSPSIQSRAAAGGGRFVVTLAAVAALGGFLFGFEIEAGRLLRRRARTARARAAASPRTVRRSA